MKVPFKYESMFASADREVYTEMLKTILTVVFIFICVALIIVVLAQEGKSAGLGSLSGAAETYWGKNKGRSREGRLEKGTKVLAILFMVIAAVLNLNVF